MLVFLALWLGGCFWGIAGIILATPTLAALKVVASNAAGGQQLLDFLSPHHEGHRRANELMESDVSLSVALRERGTLPPVA
jgi:hypothetical protein